MISEKAKGVSVKILTQKPLSLKQLDIEKFNAQYGSIAIRLSNDFHDRFLIIDKKTLYHIGASLKDLGKKCFAFSVIEDQNLLQNLITQLHAFQWEN
jgi:hypothetical protein